MPPGAYPELEKQIARKNWPSDAVFLLVVEAWRRHGV